MNNYFTSFCLYTYLEVNSIGTTGVLNKNRLRKYTVIGDKQLQIKKGMWPLLTAQHTSSQKTV